MIEKFDKYWKDIQGPMGIATVLDPRFKTKYLLGFFECLFGHTSEECWEKVEVVKISLYDLMKEYQFEDDEDNTESSIPSLANSGFLSSISARVASRRLVTARFKAELDRYLDDEYVLIEAENFKILDWWKVSGTRYPTLSKIAHDILLFQSAQLHLNLLLAPVGGFLVSTVVVLLRKFWRHTYVFTILNVAQVYRYI
jgi:hypothetical protein